MARLMFIRDSSPLAGARIEFVDTGVVSTADDEGRIDVELDAGTRYDLEIVHESVTYRREVDISDTSTVTVVDVAEDDLPVAETADHLSTQPKLLNDRFEFVDQLGSGGMGSVVKARDSVLDRDVAIKLLTRDLADYEEAREIFMKEARSLAKLSHPNLVSIHDVIEVEQRPMLVTEYVEGVTLEEAVQKNGGLPQSTAFQIGIQVCSAVEYLHEQQVIHRDIKPGNIMLGSDGTLKLIDFGLARSLQNLADRGTRTRGTPAYMAPEQVRGDERTASLDLYQIGVTLFETLSGQLPFDDGDMAYAHVHESPPRLDDVVPNLLPGAVDLVDACLEKNPSERPASVEVVRHELESLEEMLTSSRIDRDDLTDPNLGPYESERQPSQPVSSTSETRVRNPSDAGAVSDDAVGDEAETRVYDDPQDPPDSEVESDSDAPESEPAKPDGEPPSDESDDDVPFAAKIAGGLLLVAGIASGAAFLTGGETETSGDDARAGPDDAGKVGGTTVARANSPDTGGKTAPETAEQEVAGERARTRALEESWRRAELAANAARVAAENQAQADRRAEKASGKSGSREAARTPSNTETTARGAPAESRGGGAPGAGDRTPSTESTPDDESDSKDDTASAPDAGIDDGPSTDGGSIEPGTRDGEADAGAAPKSADEETEPEKGSTRDPSKPSRESTTEEEPPPTSEANETESETAPPSDESKPLDDGETDDDRRASDETEEDEPSPEESPSDDGNEDDGDSEEQDPSVPRTF